MLSKQKTVMGMIAGLFLLLLSLGDVSWLLVPTAHAAQQVLDVQGSIFTVINVAVGFFLTFAHLLIYICLILIGTLLSPDFMDLSNGNGMAKVLLGVWQIARNITNIILAFLLIIGGILTVVKAGDTVVKTYATKFVVAVILVNFSWFFPRVLLDLANVLTATVYSLPSAIPSAKCIPLNAKGEKEGGSCQYISEFSFGKKPDGNGWECPLSFSKTDPLVCVKYADLSSSANHPNAIIGGIIVNYSRLRYMSRVIGQAENAGPAQGNAAWDKLPQQLTYTVMSLMTVLFSVMLLFPLVAMVVVFLVRIPVIWITVAFMPFMFLGYVAGDLMGNLDTKKMILNKFLKAAFLPVIVAIPFSVGFIMLNVAMSQDPKNALTVATGIPLLAGVKNLWQLLWVAMSMGVIWYGSFMAMKFDEDLAKLIAPIEGAGKNMMGFMGKLPLLVPLPLPGGGPGGQKTSGMQLIKMLSNPEQTFAPGGKLITPAEAMRRAAGGGAHQQTVNKLAEHLNVTSTTTYNQQFNDTIKKINDAPNDAAAKTATDALHKLVREKDASWRGNANDLERLIEDLKTKGNVAEKIKPNKAKD